MKNLQTKLASVLFALALGASFAYAGSNGDKCGTGKCGSGMDKKVEKCGAGKCGSGMDTKAKKCGAGKCGAGK